MGLIRGLAGVHLLAAVAGVLGAVVVAFDVGAGLTDPAGCGDFGCGLGVRTAAVLLGVSLPLLGVSAAAVLASSGPRAARFGLACGLWVVAVLSGLWATQMFPFVVFLLVPLAFPPSALVLLPTLLLVVTSGWSLVARQRRRSGVRHLCSDA